MTEPWHARPEYAVPLEEALQRLEVIPDCVFGDDPAPGVRVVPENPSYPYRYVRSLTEVVALIEERGVEEALLVGHGLAIKDERGWLFLQTKPDG